MRFRDLVPSATLRDHARRRLAFALARFGGWIREVELTLADVNGPRGGVDKLCRVRVHGAGVRDVIIEQRAAATEAAIDRAADRAAQSLGRTLDRRRRGRTPAVG
jgi:hypothetical protein